MANELTEVSDLIERAVSGATEEQLTVHPDGKWSSAQILEHLALTYSGTTKGMGRVLQKGKPLGGRRSLRDLLLQFTLLKLEFFPPGRKAPAMVVPSGTLGGMEALKSFRTEFSTMSATLEEVEQRFGRDTVVLNHPVLGPLDVSQWRRFHLAHARHHAKQIDRLRALQSVASAAGA
jgi:hypothetical protein